MDSRDGTTRLVRFWDRMAPTYDSRTRGVERRVAADSRRWVCDRARGATLELACGTGANFAYYPAGIDLTATDWSPAMLGVARRRATDGHHTVTLLQADAAALPFADSRFGTVTCTFGLCAIPDDRAALAEALRVLRPGGSLLLADHVIATGWPLRVLQRAADLVTVPLHGEHYSRRPLAVLATLDAEIVATERLNHGVIERVHARKPLG